MHCCLLGFVDLLAIYLRCSFVHFQVGLQAFREEAVYHVAPVNSLSDDRSGVVVVHGDGALACACARARNIERGEGALIRPHEGVIHEVSVDVLSRDRARGVVAFRKAALACSCARARNVVRGKCAIGRPHEAMKHTVYVDVDAFDFPVRSEAYAECAVEAARGVIGTRGIERRDGAVGSAQKTVTHEVCVKVESRDRAHSVDGVGVGEYGASGIEFGDDAVRSAHEAVLY